MGSLLYDIIFLLVGFSSLFYFYSRAMSVGESIQDMVNITLKNEINRIEELILKNIEFSYHHKILLDREIQLINELLRKIDMEEKRDKL